MNRLEFYRLKCGMSQAELAKKTSIFQSEISRAEKGVKDLKGLQWASLANALGCTVEELLGIAK